MKTTDDPLGLYTAGRTPPSLEAEPSWSNPHTSSTCHTRGAPRSQNVHMEDDATSSAREDTTVEMLVQPKLQVAVPMSENPVVV